MSPAGNLILISQKAGEPAHRQGSGKSQHHHQQRHAQKEMRLSSEKEDISEVLSMQTALGKEYN